MTAAPVVTGYGVFTAFGYGADALLSGTFLGRHAFGEPDRFDVARFRGRTAAVHPNGPRTQREAFTRCARDALAMAGIDRPAELPLLLGTKGDFTGITDFWRSGGARDGDLPASLPARLAEDVGDELGLGRPRLAFTNACVASTNAIAHGAALVRAGRADAVLCGGVYLVDEEVFAKFDAMYAFAHDGRVRPFAKTRSGLLLGDGAAALVLESAEHAAARGARPLARVSGAGMSGDAHHVVRPHPEGHGMDRALTTALASAGVRPDQVDYVNAHGTATVTNDVAETRALHRALGEHARTVPVSSTKSTTGHPLEASGAVQAVIALVALEHELIPPTAGHTEPDPLCDLDYVPNEPRAARLSTVATMSCAFGGLNAALVLERT